MGDFGKENPGVRRSDVSIFLRWRPVQISSEHLLSQLYVPGRRLLGDSEVLDCCVAKQRGNGKWREKGNGLEWGRVLMGHSAHRWRTVHFLYVILSPALSALAPSEYISILPRGEIRALGIILGTHLIGSSQ